MNTTVEVRSQFGFPTFVPNTQPIPSVQKTNVTDYRVVDADGIEEDHYDQLGAI